MKTLTIALCLLLVVLPASAQRLTVVRPDFYVPYGVRDVSVNVVEPESSSAAVRLAESGPLPNAPMPRQYPMRRRAHRRFRPGYGANLQPPSASTGAVIAGLVAIGVVLAVVARGDH